MRVIVATGLNDGDAEYKNMGDVAMLQVAVTRLMNLWPDHQIQVLTDSPSDLARYCPGTSPLPRAGCMCWIADRVLLGRFHELLPAWCSRGLSRIKRSIGLRWPKVLKLLIELRLAIRDVNGRRRDFRTFLEALNRSDLLVICGSGGFADSCRAWNVSILNTMEAAMQHGMPVVMFGQGVGPLSDADVLSRAKDVLPKASLITLRGTRGGLSLLESLGVSAEKVRITGDEAVELAYAARTEQGSAVGINLRVASYANVETDIVTQVCSALQKFARLHSALLLPIPIAFHGSANDRDTIRQLLAGLDDQSDGGTSLDTPSLLIKEIARCRIVVTGAYHAAVFALAQGIPVVCLSRSPYYLAKFQGLQDLFHVGCTIVALDQPEMSSTLLTAMEDTWKSADAVRLLLLQSACQQVHDSRRAYEDCKESFYRCMAGSTPTNESDRNECRN